MKKNTTHNLTVAAMLSAVAFILMFIEFPLPMLIPSFVKMDFSDLPALLGAFALGPVYGVAISFMKNLLHIVVKGTSTADAERDVRVSGAGGRLRLVGHPGFVHQLQACAVRESEKVGAEVRPRVVIARIRHGVKIAHKEVLCSLEVVDVQGDVLDFHSVSFLCFTR